MSRTVEGEAKRVTENGISFVIGRIKCDVDATPFKSVSGTGECECMLVWVSKACFMSCHAS